jgi:hypothetical protein
MKKLAGFAAIALGVLFFSGVKGYSTSLPPGGSVSLSANTATGVVVASVSGTITSNSNAKNSVDFRQEVAKEAGGTYDFLYQFQVAKGAANPVVTLNSSFFDSFTTNVYQQADGTGFVGTGFAKGTSKASAGLRSADGQQVTFDFNAGAGVTTYVLVVQTNARDFAFNGISGVNFRTDGGGVMTTYMPEVPEPGTLVLWGGVFGGLAIFGAVRHRRSKIKPASTV